MTSNSKAKPRQQPAAGYVGRSDYITPEIPIDEQSAGAYRVSHLEQASEKHAATLQIWKAFEIPPRSIRQSLIDTFMAHCYDWTPIVGREDLEEKDGEYPSLLLLQAVFLAASRVSSSSAVAAYATTDEFYQRAKALFWSGHEKNALILIISVCILQWYNPDGPEHVSVDTSKFWMSVAIGLAHQIGLHKEPPGHFPDASLRRRVWWSLVVSGLTCTFPSHHFIKSSQVRDCLISTGQGRPRCINMKDCEVRPPCREDFSESPDFGGLFISYVDIVSILGDITVHLLRKSMSHQRRLGLEIKLRHWLENIMEPLQLCYRRMSDDEGQLSLSPYNFKARQLYVPYFTALNILHRASHARVDLSLAAVLASSLVAGIFEDFLSRDELRYLGPIYAFYLLAAGIALVPALSIPQLHDAADKDLGVIHNCQRELARRWPSAIGASKALDQIMAAGIEQRMSLNFRHPTLRWVLSEDAAYFESFSHDLCRCWHPIFSLPHAQGNNVGRARDPEKRQSHDYILQDGFSLALEGAPEGVGCNVPGIGGINTVGAGEAFNFSEYPSEIGDWLVADLSLDQEPWNY